MSACQKCWSDAGGDSTAYAALVLEREASPCTPEEQAGPDARQCEKCGRMTAHPHTGRCMAVQWNHEPQPEWQNPCRYRGAS